MSFSLCARLQAYQWVRSISEGSYGDCHVCRDVKNGDELVAVKRLKAAHLDENVREPAYARPQ